MILTCIVPRCTSSSKNNKDLKFHRLPRDAERCKEWIEACQRTEWSDKSPAFFLSKFVCSLHFDKSMYKNRSLHQSAIPIYHLNATAVVQDSCTQTWESIKFSTLAPDISEVPGTFLKKIEVKTSHTQTEECMPCANYLEIKEENNMTVMDDYNYNNMQCVDLKSNEERKIKEDDTQLNQDETEENKFEIGENEIEIEVNQSEINESEIELNEYTLNIKENKKSLITDDCVHTSTDSEQESEDDLSDMSIDEFLNLNEGLESEIRMELAKKNIPQIPVVKATNSKAMLEGQDEPTFNPSSDDETDGDQESESQPSTSNDQPFQTSVDDFLLDLNQGLEKQIVKAMRTINVPLNNGTIWSKLHKETQTEPVSIYDIPSNNKCFEQCLRCGKNASRLGPKYLKPEHLITLEDFEYACEKYLSPTFSTTVKNQIKLERILYNNSLPATSSQWKAKLGKKKDKSPSLENKKMITTKTGKSPSPENKKRRRKRQSKPKSKKYVFIDYSLKHWT